MREAVAVVAALTLTFALVPFASAAPEERLYPSGDVVREPSATDCQTMPYYGLAAQTPADGKAYAALSTPGLSCPWGFEYTVPFDFALTGDMVVHAAFSCDQAAVGASEDGVTRSVIFTLTQNGNDVGEDDWAGVISCTAGSATDVVINVGGSGTSFAAGDTLGIDVVVFAGPNAPPGTAPDLHIVAGADSSFIEAPGFVPPATGPTSQTVMEDLEHPTVAHGFTNATSDTYILNFTNELENVTASFAWNATGGSVLARLNGPDGVAFEETFEGDGSQEETFQGVPSGAWNLTLTYSNFTGSLDFALEDTATAGGEGVGGTNGDGTGGTGGSPGSGDDDADGNATGNETVDGADDQESPGLPMLVGLGTVALVAALRRRR